MERANLETAVNQTTNMQNSVIVSNTDPDCRNDSADENKGSSEPATFEDTVINILESACNVFDNIYFAKSLGIISDKNFLYRHLNNGEWGSKLWLITLILSARKLLRQLFKTMKARSALKSEIKITQLNSKSLINDVLTEKLRESLDKCSALIRDKLFDLFQTFIYFIIASISLFKIAVPRKWKRVLEPLSNFVTLMRFFTVVR
ncbi:hypothetical protein HG535_0A00280 [Zygotorulaspora mrakii]|uniref:Uncharacterized protein n=1 Tax=Zygotorulaspora mrakii TaxID=42260 RepID=A0A7H9AV15_ZYGMR|nr:uncharacterized protein HG535_0A00280 [Zygotorulaspora mrakii]QLG70088.1 hypothetical protein HG535_0A00280 [Zygotorulaspora mrakii]